MKALQTAIVDYQIQYNSKKLLSGKRLNQLATKEYVNDMSKALDNMFKFYYLSGRAKINETLKKELLKYDKKQADKISFKDIEDNIGKQFRTKEAIKSLVDQLELKSGNIYKTRLDIDELLKKAKKIAILSYSDYVARVNTKLLVALEDYENTPYKTFINLIESDQIKNLSVQNLVDVRGYWTTVFSTNISSIFHAGYLDQLEEVKEFIEYEQYNAVVKEHEQCKALAGTIAKVGEFEANGNTIPAGWNCTAFFTPISKVRAEALNIEPTKYNKSIKPDSGFGGKTTAKKTSTLPKKTGKRLPSGYTKLM